MTRIDYFYDAAEQSAYQAENGAANARVVAGTADAVIEQIRAYQNSGCERIMLQWLDLDDMDRMEALAKTVLPAFHS